MDFVAIDFETCNETRRSACSVAVVVVESGVIVDRYHSLIRPQELRFHPMTMAVHGIPEASIREAPPLCDVWPELCSRINGKTVLAHNASFDVSVLRHSLHSCGIPICEFNYHCSVKLARGAWPEYPLHKLDYICSQQAIPLVHHDAESDATACAHVTMAAMSALGVKHLADLESLHAITPGYVYDNESWVPPCSPSFRSVRKTFEITLPDGYDIKTHPLNGKNVLITGTLTFCTKDCGYAAAELLGAHPQNGVTKKSDVVVIGEVDAKKLAEGAKIYAKHQKALDYRNLGYPIEIIDEETFLQLLTEPTEICNDGNRADRSDDGQDSSDVALA